MVQDQDLSRPPKVPLRLAVNHARNRRDALEVYLSDPYGTPEPVVLLLGAEYLGIIQSLVSTCRMHEVDPYTRLVDVLQRITAFHLPTYDSEYFRCNFGVHFNCLFCFSPR